MVIIFVGKLYSLCRFRAFSGRIFFIWLNGCISRFCIKHVVDDLSINTEISIRVAVAITQIVVNFIDKENISFEAREVT